MNAPRRHTIRPAFALLLTLLTTVLLASIVSQLVVTTATESVRAARLAHTLAHELAADSTVRVTAAALRQDASIPVSLDRDGIFEMRFEVGIVATRVRIADDAAKLDVRALTNERHLVRKLNSLARRAGLPQAQVRLRPIGADRNDEYRPYIWFDQLLEVDEPDVLFATDGDDCRRVWSDLLTCFGDDRVNVRRAPRAVLEVLFEDIDPSLIDRIVRARGREGSVDLGTLLEDVNQDTRSRIGALATWNSDHYALTIRTTINADSRRWYVVATIADDQVHVHHGGPIRW